MVDATRRIALEGFWRLVWDRDCWRRGGGGEMDPGAGGLWEGVVVRLVAVSVWRTAM
jgi:hypothetical protein